jgi:hypothetical protein
VDVTVNRWRVRCALVYWPDATLAQYWCTDEVRFEYTRAGVAPPPVSAFGTHVRVFIPGLGNEVIGYSLIGLLYGYPLRETLRLLKSRK